MLETIRLDCKVEFIKFTSKELSAICPVNGRPDYYDLIIEFSPKEHTLEVSTLRKYLLSFRSDETFAENLANEICQELYHILEPHYLSINLCNRPENGIGIEIFQQLGWENKL